jgi:predicted oxidoreductase
MYSGFTVGGLATNVDGQVLREDGSPIAGLYAAAVTQLAVRWMW